MGGGVNHKQKNFKIQIFGICFSLLGFVVSNITDRV